MADNPFGNYYYNQKYLNNANTGNSQKVDAFGSGNLTDRGYNSSTSGYGNGYGNAYSGSTGNKSGTSGSSSTVSQPVAGGSDLQSYLQGLYAQRQQAAQNAYENSMNALSQM